MKGGLSHYGVYSATQYLPRLRFGLVWMSMINLQVLLAIVIFFLVLWIKFSSTTDTYSYRIQEK